MSLRTLISEHVSSVFLNTDHFAESILRYVGGNPSDVVTLTGVVTFTKPEQDYQRGTETHIKGEVLFADSVEITASDSLLINGSQYSVENVSAPRDGAITAYIVRRVPQAKGARPMRGQF